MAFDGSCAHVEGLRDFGVGGYLGEFGEDLSFAVGEGVEAAGSVSAGTLDPPRDGSPNGSRARRRRVGGFLRSTSGGPICRVIWS